MTGWTSQKAGSFKKEFYKFLEYVRIDSKELGTVILGEHLYRAQHRFFDFVFDGLVDDIHEFDHLKSRQLGISTGSRALTLFWAGMHDGLRGYMVFDTTPHTEEGRVELVEMVKALPKSLGFPGIQRENRNFVMLENGTRINFAAAGTKVTKSSGTLGRSSGINFSHGSEICSWAGGENITAFRNTFAKDFPNRLFLWESTGRGFNTWHDMWQEAKEDPRQRTLFTGWWAKDNQIIRSDDPSFERYGIQAPTAREIARIQEVEARYGWRITPEQLAWVRRESDPGAMPEGDAPVEYEPDSDQLAEQAWTENDAFQLAGSIFFQPEKLREQAERFVSNKFTSWSFAPGVEFADMKVFPSANGRSTELKVWEEPASDAVYILAADPAFGANERNDRSAISVSRCYADGIDQVAEYAWPLVTTRAFAWIILAIAAWYAGDRSEVWMIIELNGPGEAVWNEILGLQRNLKRAYFASAMEEKGLKNVFRNVRNFIYTRSDSFAGGRAWQWKLTSQLKETIMEELRSQTQNFMLRIRSLSALQEMRSVTRDGASIEAQGANKDDRVLALAMTVHCWQDRVRSRLISQRRTRQYEEAKSLMTLTDKIEIFNRFQLDAFFQQQAVERRRVVRALRGPAAWKAR